MQTEEPFDILPSDDPRAQVQALQRKLIGLTEEEAAKLRGADQAERAAFIEAQEKLGVLEERAKAAEQQARASLTPAAELLRFFEFEHLPPDLKAVSKECKRLADWAVKNLPQSREHTAGLRKLLEAKDCLVRAALLARP